MGSGSRLPCAASACRCTKWAGTGARVPRDVERVREELPAVSGPCAAASRPATTCPTHGTLLSLTTGGCLRRSCAQRASAAETLPARHPGTEGDSQVSEVRPLLPVLPPFPNTACPLHLPRKHEPVVTIIATGARSLARAPVATQDSVADAVWMALRRSTDLLIRRLPFARLVRDPPMCWRAPPPTDSELRLCSRVSSLHPHSVAMRQTKEISDEYCGQSYRWQAEALMALQEAAEVYS